MFFTRPGLAEGRGSFMMRVGLNRHGRSLQSNVCFVTRQKVCPLRKQRRCDRRGSEGKEEERRKKSGRENEKRRREEKRKRARHRAKRAKRQQPEPHFFVRATLLHSTLYRAAQLLSALLLYLSSFYHTPMLVPDGLFPLDAVLLPVALATGARRSTSVLFMETISHGTARTGINHPFAAASTPKDCQSPAMAGRCGRATTTATGPARRTAHLSKTEIYRPRKPERQAISPWTEIVRHI